MNTANTAFSKPGYKSSGRKEVLLQRIEKERKL
jgi:hypothetical protein